MDNKKKGKGIFIAAILVISVFSVFTVPVIAIAPGAGAGPATQTIGIQKSVESVKSMSPNGYDYNSLIFTVDDVVFFSYEDGTMLELYDSTGVLVWNNGGAPLDKGGHAHVAVARGVYKASGSKKFAVLTGDPITRTVVGYYAMDQNGYGASTEIYTWVPSHAWDGEKFIVFAYEDSTSVTISYTDTGTVIWSGTLNKGEHRETTGVYSSYLHVTSNKPVSALTYFDQGYFVPSANKKWSGTEFYTYVGTIGGWTEDLSVIAYSGGTLVTIKDSGTGTTIWSGTLNNGQAHVESFNVEKYITITSSDTVTVSVQPWVSSTIGYHQGAYVPDRVGVGIGTDLIGSTLDDGYLYILAYKDGTNVNVYNSQTGVLVGSYTLNAGDYVDANPGNGLWRIRSNNYVSAYSGWNTWNADFAPVEFGEIVPPPPAPVPAIAPIGLIALIGLLSVVAAVSIRTSIRKKRR